ncbi:uncharacterized protein FRV6_13067 [Fusarium oxysporum]|uniref:Uncharacterized protein n=1 Tax=Fusarium oxysporum TaxID=5507 RepID=A0A2H3U4C8_FUSOX|nr:uncharacterized protein FRV6_13067 [Fusarium oxysporum]
MREGAGTETLFKLAFYADRIVLLDSWHLQRSPCANSMTDIRSQEAGRILPGNDLTAPEPWLRRLGPALRLKDVGGKKDFLRDFITMDYEVDLNDPEESDDA